MTGAPCTGGPRRRLGRLAGALALVVTGCSGSEPAEPPRPAAGVAVASFNFAESRLLAEIYAQALEHEGVEVRRELDLGPRELVMPAMRQGLVDIVPEYLGTALTAAEPTAAVDPSDPEAVHRALAAAVAPWDLEVLQHAAAQNQNGLVVTRSTATRLGLRTISDLAAVAPTLRLGGPPECPERAYCLQGLGEVYGLTFQDFVPLDGQALVRRGLVDEVIDVGVLFTTDGAVAGSELVLLDDDRALQPAENVVPLARSEVLDGPRGEVVAATLDAISARLTTANLQFLNWRVAVAGNTPAAEARGWLIRQGLVDR
jgi:osmoprotectant transport system substrate-binding protein